MGYQVVQDVATERAVLSGIAQFGKDALVDVQDLINVNSFANEDNKIIFRCLEHALTDSETIDMPSFLAAASSLSLYEAVSSKSQADYLRSVFNMPILLENVRKHARRLMKLELIRKAQSKHKSAYVELSEMVGDETVDEILAASERPVFDLMTELNDGRGDTPLQIAFEGDEYLQNKIDNPVEMVGIATPWGRFNNVIGGGCRRGGVVLIAARPKTGKTTLAKECALHVAGKLNIPVLMLDTEMVKDDQFERSLASLSKVPTNRITTGQFGQNEMEKTAVFEANKYLKTIPYYHKSVAGKSFEQILSIIRRWIIKEVGYDENGKVKDCLVLYDYFKLMSDDDLDKMQEYQALGFQISRLTDFCKEYDFPCLSFVQVNRDGIAKETSDIVAQSDRLLWLCHALLIFKRKSEEEMVEAGVEHGNTKMVPLECRYGPGMDHGDYINMKLNGDISSIEEGFTHFELKKNKHVDETGFEYDDSDESELM